MGRSACPRTLENLERETLMLGRLRRATLADTTVPDATKLALLRAIDEVCRELGRYREEKGNALRRATPSRKS